MVLLIYTEMLGNLINGLYLKILQIGPSVDGNDVRVAYYGAYSGKTDLDGVTAELIYYDHDNPPSDIMINCSDTNQKTSE